MDGMTHEDNPAFGPDVLVDVTAYPLLRLLEDEDSVLAHSLGRVLYERESQEEVVAGHGVNAVALPTDAPDLR